MLAPHVSLPEGELTSLLTGGLSGSEPSNTSPTSTTPVVKSRSLFSRALSLAVSKESSGQFATERRSTPAYPPSLAAIMEGGFGEFSAAFLADSQSTAAEPRFAAPAEPSGSDRRVFPRHDSECDVYITARGTAEGTDAVTWHGRVVDVSMGGLALRTDREMQSGQVVGVQICNPHFAEALEIDATVLRCQTDTHDGWHVVCSLNRRLTFEQINFVGKRLFASTLV